MLNLLRGPWKEGFFFSRPYTVPVYDCKAGDERIECLVGVKIFNQPLRVQRHVARWCNVSWEQGIYIIIMVRVLPAWRCWQILMVISKKWEEQSFILFFFIIYSKLTSLWIHNVSILLSIFIGKTAKQLKRIFVNIMLQSEIFETLLEEAEQMHIKRKEATEMLKVQ